MQRIPTLFPPINIGCCGGDVLLVGVLVEKMSESASGDPVVVLQRLTGLVGATEP